MHASGAGVLKVLNEYPRTLAPLHTHAHCTDRRRPAWRVQEEEEEEEEDEDEDEDEDMDEDE
jgi:hypothetical protein